MSSDTKKVPSSIAKYIPFEMCNVIEHFEILFPKTLHFYRKRNCNWATCNFDITLALFIWESAVHYPSLYSDNGD